MKLTWFKTEYSFGKWFIEKKNCDKFPFIEINLRGVDEPVEICRLTDKNRTIGIVLYTQWDKNELYINLFEIQKKYRNKGYGKKMLEMLLKETKPKFVLLDYCDGDSKKFWKSLGFHRRMKHAVDETEMYKNIKRYEII